MNRGAAAQSRRRNVPACIKGGRKKKPRGRRPFPGARVYWGSIASLLHLSWKRCHPRATQRAFLRHGKPKQAAGGRRLSCPCGACWRDILRRGGPGAALLVWRGGERLSRHGERDKVLVPSRGGQRDSILHGTILGPRSGGAHFSKRGAMFLRRGGPGAFGARAGRTLLVSTQVR
jgi:hypothetical protein